jgi:hypothetical protein
MNRYILKPFSQPPSPYSVSVDSVAHPNNLRVEFTLQGDLESLNLPNLSDHPERIEGLYHHTCFEIFLKKGESYLEWNFAFSGDWCLFLFESYRKKSAQKVDLDSSFFNLSHISHSNSEANLKVEIPLDRLSFLGDLPPEIGFSCVLEHPKNIFSYWALAHVSEKPDFHQPASFIAKL